MYSKLKPIVRSFLAYMMCNMFLLIIWSYLDTTVLNFILSWMVCPIQVISWLICAAHVADKTAYSLKNLILVLVSIMAELIIFSIVEIIIIKVIMASVIILEIGIFIFKVCIGNEEQD